MLTNLFFVLLAGLAGGIFAKVVKIPSLVGYILAGIVSGLVFSFDPLTSQNLTELGVILLLFSVGLELSLEKLMKIGQIATIGAISQIILVTCISFLVLSRLGNFSSNEALVLSFAFSLSSTALVVKIMADRNETETIHYEILAGWCLIQDLAVIPMVVLLPILTLSQNSPWFAITISSILTTTLVLAIVFLVGKVVAPYLTHFVAGADNRELLILLAITLALGIATLVGLFGISAAFGAFLAGIVISKTQENHAIFSETRPLRDIFSILFFVSLGFLVTPQFILSHLLTILTLSIFVIILKLVVTFIICLIFGYKGKTAVAVSLGLSQIGEFAFVFFLISQRLGILSPDLASLGAATALVTLLVSPFLFKGILPVWHELKRLTVKWPSLNKLFAAGAITVSQDSLLKDHIIICGYGRMGRWIGKALKEIEIPFIIIDYNQKVIHDALQSGMKAIYGDASYAEILKAAEIENAKALIITLPDHTAQEEIIAFCQVKVPNIKIMARAHLDTDLKKLVGLKVNKVVQPEFEAALAIVKNILTSSGHPKEEVAKKMKTLRLSHANI